MISQGGEQEAYGQCDVGHWVRSVRVRVRRVRFRVCLPRCVLRGACVRDEDVVDGCVGRTKDVDGWRVSLRSCEVGDGG